jgi:peptidoglycan hydrolase CwlO-like protein
MDDRKKRISELEHRKREQIVQLDALLTRLGEGIFGRMADDPHVSGIAELSVYQGFQSDIANSQASIQAAEEQIRRSKELDQNIDAAEREEIDTAKELAIAYSKLGKLLLEFQPRPKGVEPEVRGSPLDENSGECADFCAPYRDQNEALLTKVFSLEERLDELEKKEGGNVFTWIGKGAQSLVLRSFLTKAQENLEQLRRNVGECYSKDRKLSESGNDLSAGNSGIAAVCAEIEGKQAHSNALSSNIAALKEERRKINSSFSAEGGPVKHINTIKNHIANVQNDLKALYRRMGAECASIDLKDTARGGAGRRQTLDSLLLPQDGDVLENASRIDKTIHDCEDEIKKLEALLAIDDEKAKIDKFRKMIQEKRDKIAKAEQDIAEYEEGIRDSEAFIQKLQNLL